MKRKLFAFSEMEDPGAVFSALYFLSSGDTSHGLKCVPNWFKVQSSRSKVGVWCPETIDQKLIVAGDCNRIRFKTGLIRLRISLFVFWVFSASAGGSAEHSKSKLSASTIYLRRDHYLWPAFAEAPASKLRMRWNEIREWIADRRNCRWLRQNQKYFPWH